jgi:hypothetical protein
MRVYSEQEVSQILERAAERQARAPTPPVGLTLDDLERLGAEVGLDAAHLRAAAAEVDAGGGAAQRRSRSAAHLYVERWVPGALTEGTWEDLVAELQNRFGKSGTAGQIQQVGRNREWSHTDGLGVETRVLVSDRGDRVRLRLSQRVGLGTSLTDAAFVGILLGWLPGAALAALLGTGGVTKGALALTSVVLIGVVTFVLDRLWRNRMHDRLDALADALADLAGPPLAAPAVPVQTPIAEPPAPALRLDEPEPLPDAEPVSPARTGAGRAQ